MDWRIRCAGVPGRATRRVPAPPEDVTRGLAHGWRAPAMDGGFAFAMEGK